MDENRGDERRALPDEPFRAAIRYLVALGERRLARLAAETADESPASQPAATGSESGSTASPR